MNHITKDILFSLIEGNLTEDLHKEAEDHLATCDRCFTLYASLKSSNIEIENAELESTPQDIYLKAESEMGIIQQPEEPQTIDKGIYVPKEKYETINPNISYSLKPADEYQQSIEKPVKTQSRLRLGSIFIPLAFVAVITFIIVDNNQQINQVPMAEKTTSPKWKTQDLDQTLKASKEAAPLTDVAKKTVLPKDLIEKLKMKDQSIVLAYYDPSENTMVTRTIPSPRKVPDLMGKNLEEIEIILKSEGIRYIVYKSTEFKQFPEPNKYLMSNDTLKIYYNN